MIGTKYFSALKREFTGYDAKKAQKDILAGLTCTAVALPLALAFGVSSGADAAAGLICAIIAGLVIGMLSGASYQLSGPTGAMAAILFGLVATHGIEAMFFASFLSGVFLLFFAVINAGKLVNFIPRSVVTGFTSGIAIIIALGQIDNAFGTVSQGGNAIEKVASYFTLGFHPRAYAVMFTVLSMAIMIFWPKKAQKIVPGSLMAIVICLIVNMIFKFDVGVVGEIPRTLLPEARLNFRGVDYSQIGTYISSGFSIAVLGMVESLLCGASAGKMKNEKLDNRQELIAQGVGNVIIPFFGGVPATAAIARTSVAIKSGGQTRLVSVWHAVGLLLSMFLLGPWMAQIPLAALSGVLLVTAWRMNDMGEIKLMFGRRLKTSIAQFLVTMIATVVFDLTVAILLGVVLSIILFVIRLRTELEIDREKVPEKPYATILNVAGALFFATQEKLPFYVDRAKEDGYTTIVLNLRGALQIDHSAADELLSIYRDAKRQGVRIVFTGITKYNDLTLTRTEFFNEVSEEDIDGSELEAYESI